MNTHTNTSLPDNENLERLVRWLAELKSGPAMMGPTPYDGRHIALPNAMIAVEGWWSASHFSRGRSSTQEYNGPAYISMLFSSNDRKQVYRIASNKPFSVRTPSFSFVAPFSDWTISDDEVRGSCRTQQSFFRYALARIKPLTPPHFIHREYNHTYQ